EPHCGVGGDRAPRVENVGDAAGRHADVERQPIGGELARHKFSLEQAAGMGNGGHVTSFGHPLWYSTISTAQASPLRNSEQMRQRSLTVRIPPRPDHGINILR